MTTGTPDIRAVWTTWRPSQPMPACTWQISIWRVRSQQPKRSDARGRLQSSARVSTPNRVARSRQSRPIGLGGQTKETEPSLSSASARPSMCSPTPEGSWLSVTRQNATRPLPLRSPLSRYNPWDTGCKSASRVRYWHDDPARVGYLTWAAQLKCAAFDLCSQGAELRAGETAWAFAVVAYSYRPCAVRFASVILSLSARTT